MLRPENPSLLQPQSIFLAWWAAILPLWASRPEPAELRPLRTLLLGRSIPVPEQDPARQFSTKPNPPRCSMPARVQGPLTGFSPGQDSPTVTAILSTAPRPDNQSPSR